MDVECKTVDLLRLKNRKLWAQLLELTVEGWRAQRTFKSVQYYGVKSIYRKFKIRFSFVDNKIVAWASLLEYKDRNFKSELWAYTSPEFRRKGLQRDYLMAYARRYWKKDLIYKDNNAQRFNTFKYYKFSAIKDDQFQKT